MRRPASFLILLALGFTSCASPPTRPTLPLSNEVFHSPDSSLRGRIPRGWFVSHDQQLAPHAAVWLVSRDYSASIVFYELHLDRNTTRRVAKEGICLLAAVSFQLKQLQQPAADLISQPMKFKLRGRDHCRYDYSTRKGAVPSRVVVLHHGDRFFESTVSSVNEALTYYELFQLFALQEAVLMSLHDR